MTLSSQVGMAGLALVGAALLTTAPVAADPGPNDKLPVLLDRSLHITAEDSCSAGNLWQGSGNPNATFQRKVNPDTNVELGLKAIIRQGPDIRSSYVDGDGLVHIVVPAGPQIGNPARAAWNFTYSFNSALDPSNPDLSEYDAELWIDLDPSDQTDYLKLEMQTGGPVTPGACPEPDRNGYQWATHGVVAIPDDEGTSKVSQNSQNYAFYIAAIGDTDKKTPGVQPYAYGPAQFDVVLQLTSKAGGPGQKTTTLHVVFDVVAP